MKYKFTMVGNESGESLRHWILEPPAIVGRDPSSEMVIDDPSISRRHCQFLVDPYGSLVIRDLESKNGVHLENRRIDKAIVPLGTVVRVGLVKLRVEMTDEEANSNSYESTADAYDLAETEKVRIIRPDDDVYEIG